MHECGSKLSMPNKLLEYPQSHQLDSCFSLVVVSMHSKRVMEVFIPSQRWKMTLFQAAKHDSMQHLGVSINCCCFFLKWLVYNETYIKILIKMDDLGVPP